MKNLNLFQIQIVSIFYLIFCIELSRQNDNITDQRVYETKRFMHKQAIDSILKYESRIKQYDLVTVMIKKIVQILKVNQDTLVKNAILPGDNIPENKELHEAYLLSLENSAFISDLALRFPDLVHLFLSKITDALSVINWSISFASRSPIIPNRELKLFHLASQEFGFIEKEQDYVNPYREDKEKKPAQENIKIQKKTKKKIPKNPRMSKIDL